MSRQIRMKTQNMIVLTLEFTTNSSIQPGKLRRPDLHQSGHHTPIDVVAFLKVSESTRHPCGISGT
jgi:hypothetical protein